MFRVMMLTSSLMLSACLFAAEFPQAFEYVNGLEKTRVVLEEDGRANFSEHIRGSNGLIKVHDALKARWQWCDENSSDAAIDEKPRRGCIVVTMSLMEEGRIESIKIIYMYSESQLREFDERGITKTLARITSVR
jgi:hypothetical protein